MIDIVLLIGAISIVGIAMLRSLRLMNTITIAYTLIVFSLAAHTLLSASLPVFFLQSQFFFLDTLGAYWMLLSSFIFLLAAIYARGYVDSLIQSGELHARHGKLFYVTFHLLLMSVILTLSSNNLALLWISAEFTTLFSAILVVLLNAKENIIAAIKYVFITSTAMLFSFVGIIILFAASGEGLDEATLNWNILVQHAGELPFELLLFSSFLIFIGFAAKSGIVPFHAWLPPAHAKAPSDVSVLISGSIASIGIYALLRLYALLAPTPVQGVFSSLLLFFGIVSLAVAALSMIKRTNLKKLIAFSTIEHAGIMLIGISVGAVFWVLLYLLAHTLAKALLFFSAGILHRQYHGIKAEFLHDIFKLQPLASWGLVIGSATVLGMPLLPLFAPKFFILAQLGSKSVILLGAVLVSLLIAAGGFTWFIMQLLRHEEAKLPAFKAPLSMCLPLIVLIILLLTLGMYAPEHMQSLLQTAVHQLGL